MDRGRERRLVLPLLATFELVSWPRSQSIIGISYTNARNFDRHEDTRSHPGETYRPSERYEALRSTHRGYRSPPRSGRTPHPYIDKYEPRPSRRRSRSPQYTSRGGDDYRGRPRASPQRSLRAEIPPAKARRYSRSPIRARRDPSPYQDRRARSPPPVRNDRIVSLPRERIEQRGFSPPRNARPRFPNENNYRPAPRERSRSPNFRRKEASRIASPISSRRSSPPTHPERLTQTTTRPHSPTSRAFRLPPSGPRDTNYRDRSPPRRTYTPIGPSPTRESVSYRNRSPPAREINNHNNGAIPESRLDKPNATQRAAGPRNGESRAPPTGPAASYGRDPPTAPPTPLPISMSAHNRPGSNPILAAPARPRGGYHRGESRDPSYGAQSGHRGGRPAPPSYHGQPSHSFDSRLPLSDYAANGPRSSHGGSGAHDQPRFAPPFRSNNSSSTTYPRTQRFSTNHLASVPAIIEGGKAMPSADPTAAKKIIQLEEDAKRLREQIDEKQREKRSSLREWDNRERESRRDGLRSELAEAQLEALSGEAIGGAAF